MTIYLTPEQVLFIHARLISKTGGSHGVRDLGSLLTAIARPQATFGEQELYPSLFSKAAALLEALVRNHPFIDGNKRTGITAAGIFLKRNGFNLIASQVELESFTIRLAQGSFSFEGITGWITVHSSSSSNGVVQVS